MSFGKWYEEKKNEENGDSTGSWFDVESLLPSTDSLSNLQPVSWNSMKQSMESQMPKQILGMGYQQRFKVFCGLLFLSALFFALAFFVGLPMITVHPQKFALSFTCGSITFMGSFGIMKGPKEHLMSMIQPDRLLFTCCYAGSMIMTIYCTFHYSSLSGYALVMVSSVAQLVALLWYLISFLPGGAAGLKYVFAAMGHLLRPLIVSCARLQAACMARCLGWMASRATSG